MLWSFNTYPSFAAKAVCTLENTMDHNQRTSKNRYEMRPNCTANRQITQCFWLMGYTPFARIVAFTTCKSTKRHFSTKIEATVFSLLLPRNRALGSHISAIISNEVTKLHCSYAGVSRFMYSDAIFKVLRIMMCWFKCICTCLLIVSIAISR